MRLCATRRPIVPKCRCPTIDATGRPMHCTTGRQPHVFTFQSDVFLHSQYLDLTMNTFGGRGLMSPDVVVSELIVVSPL